MVERECDCTDGLLDDLIAGKDGGLGVPYHLRLKRTMRKVRWVIPGSFVPFMLNLADLLALYQTENNYFSVDRLKFEVVVYGAANRMTDASIDRQWQRWKLKVERTGLGCRVERGKYSSCQPQLERLRAPVTVMIVEPQLIRDVTDAILLGIKGVAVTKIESIRDEAALDNLRRMCG